MDAKILVSGATGNVGAELVKQLTAQGQSVRAVGTNVAKIQQQFGVAAEQLH